MQRRLFTIMVDGNLPSKEVCYAENSLVFRGSLSFISLELVSKLPTVFTIPTKARKADTYRPGGPRGRPNGRGISSRTVQARSSKHRYIEEVRKSTTTRKAGGLNFPGQQSGKNKRASVRQSLRLPKGEQHPVQKQPATAKRPDRQGGG